MTPADRTGRKGGATAGKSGSARNRDGAERRGPDRPPASTPQDVLAALDEGVDEVRRFMQAWHRAVVCGKPLDRKAAAYDSHLQTDFGKWMTERSGDALLQQPAFGELMRSHRLIHEQARRLTAIVAEDQPIRTAEYDSLINHVSRFYDQARRLRDAFAKLVSEIDPLTGLHNRQIMSHDLDVEFERGQRTGGPLCLALTDIDHFKRVNDTYGHAAGDVVLASVAGRFQSNLRPYDSIYRYGGEEFLITLPNANTGTANSVLERLRTALDSAPIALPDGTRLPVTASFGLVRVDYGIPLKQSIERADKALYAAKQGGRNRTVTWSEALEESANAAAEAGE